MVVATYTNTRSRSEGKVRKREERGRVVFLLDSRVCVHVPKYCDHPSHPPTHTPPMYTPTPRTHVHTHSHTPHPCTPPHTHRRPCSWPSTTTPPAP